MKPTTRSTLSALLVLASVGLIAGCSTVNLDDSGDTQAVYELGQFEMIVDSNAAAAYNATQKAFKDLDLYQTKGDLYTIEAELAARSRDDKKVYVSIKEVNSKQTMIKIRWGTIGSKGNSRQLYDAIEKNLH